MTDAPNLHRLERRLRHLPWLASRSVDHDIALGGGGGIRIAPGSKPPPGVDLDAIDRVRGRQQPQLLARLSQCVRVVCEEYDRRTLPDPGPEGEESWASECGWLVATLPTWSTDPWCLEWIGGEVDTIHRILTEAIERLDGWKACGTCGGKITTHLSDTLATIECPECERVIAMRERRLVTTPEAADALGISEAGIWQRVHRGQLTPAGRQGRHHVFDVIDLEEARRKLGLPKVERWC